jgi:hypothetical protein
MPFALPPPNATPIVLRGCAETEADMVRTSAVPLHSFTPKYLPSPIRNVVAQAPSVTMRIRHGAATPRRETQNGNEV